MIGLLKGLLVEQVTPDGISADLQRLEPDLSPHQAAALADVLVPFIRSMSEALAWAIGLSKSRSCGRAVAFSTGSVLLYLFDEEDLLPEATFGALGLIDDAFAVHVLVRQLRDAFPFAAPPADYESPARSTIELVAAILPDGAAMALQRTCRSLVEVASALFAVPAETEAPDDGAVPSLRLRAAVVPPQSKSPVKERT